MYEMFAILLVFIKTREQLRILHFHTLVIFSLKSCSNFEITRAFETISLNHFCDCSSHSNTKHAFVSWCSYARFHVSCTSSTRFTVIHRFSNVTYMLHLSFVLNLPYQTHSNVSYKNYRNILWIFNIMQYHFFFTVLFSRVYADLVVRAVSGILC